MGLGAMVEPEEPPVAAKTELRGCEAAKAVKQEPPTSRQGRGRGAAKAVFGVPERVFEVPQYSFQEMHECILWAAEAPNATEVPSTNLRS